MLSAPFLLFTSVSPSVIHFYSYTLRLKKKINKNKKQSDFLKQYCLLLSTWFLFFDIGLGTSAYVVQ